MGRVVVCYDGLINQPYDSRESSSKNNTTIHLASQIYIGTLGVLKQLIKSKLLC